MASIQNLIEQLGDNSTPEAIQKIRTAFLEQETIWAAYFPKTRNFYLSMEGSQRTAYVFTEKQYYDQFESFMKQRDIQLACAVNKKEHRSVFLTDLYRSGFTMLLLDNNHHPFGMLLEDLIGNEDRKQFENRQLVLNRDLVSKINFCFQKISVRQATTETQDEMFQAVYNAKYMLPVDVSGMKNVETNQKTGQITYSGGGNLAVPALQTKDGQKLFPLFTDIFEIQRYDKEHKFSVQIVDFNVAANLAERSDGIVINPMGANLRLEKPLAMAIAQNKGIPVPNQESRHMTGGAKMGVYFETPDVDAVEDMLDVLCEELPSFTDVNAVYIRLAHRTTDVRPYYLFVVDGSEDQSEIYKKIAELAIPHARGFNLEFTSLDGDFGKQAVGTCKPFYQKEN